MNPKEKAVREAAAALHLAFVDARKAGLTITWPRSVEGLAALAVSETAKAEPAEPAKGKK